MPLNLEKYKNIDIEKLNHFYLLVREGSIKQVVSKYNIAERNIRHSLAFMEQKLDIKLYQPQQRNFIPTTEGKHFFEFARMIVELTNSYENTNITFPKKEDLIIFSATTIANYFLPSILTQFHKKYPYVNTQVYCGPEYLTGKNPAFDVIIADEIHDTGLVRNKIHQFNYRLYCSSDYAQKLEGYSSALELRDHDFLLFSGNHYLENNLLQYNRNIIIGNSYPFLLELCHIGMGILSCFNITPIKNRLPYLDIVNIFPEYISESGHAYLYYNRYSDKKHLIHDLISISQKYFMEIGV